MHCRFVVDIENDPKKLAPNMATVQSTMDEVLKSRTSRFGTYFFESQLHEGDGVEENDECVIGLEEDSVDNYVEADDDDEEYDEELWVGNLFWISCRIGFEN